MPVTVTVGRGRRGPLSLGARRRAARSLVAAGSMPLMTNFMLDGPLSLRRFYELVLESGHSELAGDHWPCELSALGDLPNIVFRDGNDVVLRTEDGTLARVALDYGWFSVRAAASTAAAAAAVCSAFRQQFPASYMVDDARVPITFWTLTPHGPSPRLRKIESAAWDDVQGNYTADVRAELDQLMSWQKPEADGQLLLWQGPPGTGKTWALRALASQWAPWAEFHYITDPDSFFVKDPSYMIRVHLSDSYAVIDEPTGEVYDEAGLGKWRVLILEDTGELLAANARQNYAQGLSRLLNVVDGMIGQGLRVLALVTTNDELGDLHPAVSRPGRCASQIAFGPLSSEEARAWFLARGWDEKFVGEHVEGGTLAELYAHEKEGAPALPEDALVASGQDDPALAALLEIARQPLLVQAHELDGRERLAATAMVLAAKEEDLLADIARVAEEHAPEGGYGDTYWQASTATVFWNHADWTSNEEREAAEAAFRAIEGVKDYECEAEAGPPGENWQRIWPKEEEE